MNNMKPAPMARMDDIEAIKPVRIDRLDSHWVNWFIQTQKAAAAQALAQGEATKAQIANARLADPASLANASQQVRVGQDQARVHLSVARLCGDIKDSPYFTRETLDTAVQAALEDIADRDIDDEERRQMKSGVWAVCKALGIPMEQRR